MSAPSGFETRSTDADLLQVHDEWLAHALSTEPADRPAAEEAVAQLYAAIGRPPPRFVWVRSPLEATTVLPTKDVFEYTGEWQTVEAQIAALVSDLRQRLCQRMEWRGAASRVVGEPLRRRIREGLVAAVNSTVRRSLGVGWSGQHDADWQAEFEAHQRIRGTWITGTDRDLLDVWQTLTRSTGWWWPREDVCVMADRPVAVHVDANSLLHNDKGPAIAFADGSRAYAWHGRLVPRWVVEEPTGARILAENNVEVRRCALEHLGWAAFVRDAGLTLVASAPDPGNPGFDLLLYDLPERARLLLAVNGSVERDGTRRRYGLRVPDWYGDPIAAAAWTYGLRADQYLQLRRRT